MFAAVEQCCSTETAADIHKYMVQNCCKRDCRRIWVCSATHSQIVSERQMHPEKYIRVCAFGLTEVDSQLDIADPVLV